VGSNTLTTPAPHNVGGYNPSTPLHTTLQLHYSAVYTSDVCRCGKMLPFRFCFHWVQASAALLCLAATTSLTTSATGLCVCLLLLVILLCQLLQCTVLHSRLMFQVQHNSPPFPLSPLSLSSLPFSPFALPSRLALPSLEPYPLNLARRFGERCKLSSGFW